MSEPDSTDPADTEQPSAPGRNAATRTVTEVIGIPEHDATRPGAGGSVEPIALTEGLAPPSDVPPPPEPPGRGFTQRGDRIFAGLASGSGWFVVVLIGAIGLFLLIQAAPSVLANHANFLTFRD
ncbi:MAG TPA: hypothetical protein VGH89_27475, partial [Pseudonocardia sp.]